MNDEILLYFYELEWKRLYKKIAKIERKALEVRLRIEKSKASKSSNTTCSMCGGVNNGHYVGCTKAMY